MNAIFTDPVSFIKWATTQEQQGYTVMVEARGERLFASAIRR